MKLRTYQAYVATNVEEVSGLSVICMDIVFGVFISSNLKKKIKYCVEREVRIMTEILEDLTLKYQGISINELILIADRGEKLAQYVCGMRLFNAENAPRDYKNGLIYLERAAKQGNGEALNILGVIHHNGISAAGIDMDLSKALEYYKQAMKNGNVDSYRNCGILYKNAKEFQDISKATELLQVAAEKGDTSAQRNLGSIFMGLSGSEYIDYSKAKYWYEKAVESGNDDTAANNLGVMYIDGKGTEKDVNKALYYYTIAAEQGDAKAQNGVASIYDSEFGDYAHAAYWYAKAANHGHAGAANALSIYHIDEKFGTLNTQLAFYYCKLAQIGGIAVASRNLQVLRNKLTKMVGAQKAREFELEAEQNFVSLQEKYKIGELPISYYEKEIKEKALRDNPETKTITKDAVEKAIQDITKKESIVNSQQPDAKMNSVYCPVCKSTQVTAKTMGFGFGKAVAGTLLAGPMGALGGFMGSQKNRLVCMNCGHEWTPGSKISKITDMLNK